MKFDVKKSPPASVAPPRLMAANNNPTRDVCRNFLNGKCRLGAQCHRVHPPLSNTPLRSDEVCREHSAGRCELGKNCLYRHPPQTFPSNVKSAGTQRPTSVLAAAVGEVQEAQPTTNVLRQTQPSVVLSNCVKQPDAHTPTLEATTTSQRSKSTDKLSENVPVKTATSSSAPTTTTPVVQSKMSVNTTRSDRPQVSALPLSRGDVVRLLLAYNAA
ncbi:hypothetical protein BC835DRAFT_494254 [Cytidiella melzeri]|nr:hypothetical protein BC835DRAFT_494254 [Cytidiella melzeri]